MKNIEHENTTAMPEANEPTVSSELVPENTAPERKGFLATLKAIWNERPQEHSSTPAHSPQRFLRYLGLVENDEDDEPAPFMDLSDVIVISGASGSGKDTVIEQVLKRFETAAPIVSCTTRGPRKKTDGSMEVHGVDYFFLSREEFEAKQEDGDFLEKASMFSDDLYGTPIEYIKYLRLMEKFPLIANVNAEGAMNFKKIDSHATTIFLLPPDAAAIRERLEKRASETPEERERRIHSAKEQIEAARKYDYVVVNDDLEKAVDEVCTIIRARMLSAFANDHIIDEILDSFE